MVLDAETQFDLDVESFEIHFELNFSMGMKQNAKSFEQESFEFDSCWWEVDNRRNRIGGLDNYKTGPVESMRCFTITASVL